jgi:hypothetical protein
MKKLIYLIILTVILGLVLTGCFLSNVGQVPTTGQSGINYLTKGTPFTVGNDATERPITDTWYNFTVIDTNNPSSEFGALNTFSYYAANTKPFRFVLVDEFNVVQWVSDLITPAGTGAQSWYSLTPVPVEPGWNLGLYFSLTGTVPFRYIGDNPAWYEIYNAGLPEVGELLTYVGSSNRVYSFVATGTVRYDWTGFFPPVYDEEGVLNAAKAGRAIPVKFSLGGYQGLEDDIFPLDYPKSVQVYCDGTTDSSFTIEGTVTAGGSTLNYDDGDDQYIYVWKTEKDWANTCRKLVVLLNDGTSHEAYFKFK